MQALDRMQQELAARNVSIIGIGIEDQAHVHQFRDRLGLHLPLLAGGYESLALARSFGDYQGVLPYTALLSADGRVLQSQTGALEPGQLQEWLKGAL
jgi:peroxiredoxin